MDRATAARTSNARPLRVRLFRAFYARDLAVREAQAIGLWVAFCLVWAPLMIIGEPIYELLLYSGMGQLYAMFASLALYVLPARWIGGRLSASLLERQQRRVAQGRARVLDGFWGPALIGVPIMLIVGALFTFLWIESPVVALVACAIYFLSGLALKPWQTPLRQAAAAGVFFGVALPGVTVGLWMLGH